MKRTPRSRSGRRRSARTGTSSPTATGAGPCSPSPPSRGHAWQYEERGMVDALGGLIEAGRVEALLRRQLRLGQLVPRRRSRSRSAPAARPLRGLDPRTRSCRSSRPTRTAPEITVTGVSFGAYHAANFALKRARPVPARDLPVRASTTSPVVGRGRARRRRLLQQPGRLRRAPRRRPPRLAARRTSTCCSSAGRASGRTRPARSRARAASPALLGEKGIRHELDLWGHDVPHDWPSWRAQIAHHLPAVLLMT